jgi:hypothetical protein
MRDSTDGMTDGMKDYQARERGRELADLRWHWDEAYEITWDDGKFRAARLDDGTELEADTAGELRELILCNYSERRVPRPQI